MMKQEEENYLYNIKKKEGKSSNQIFLELERDKVFQEKLEESKRRKKKMTKQDELNAQEINKRFKEDFTRLR